MPAASRFAIRLADGDIAGWRWTNAKGPRLLFAHANGFCAAAYRPMLDAVAAEAEIIAPDLRGHGQTRLPADPARHRSWRVFAADLAKLVDEVRADDPARPLFAAGHSMGAVSLMLAAEDGADLDAVFALDPVLLPEWVSWSQRSPFAGLFANANPMSRRARTRRARFPDLDAARVRYKQKRAFARWNDEALEGYLEDGFHAEAHGVALACAPEWEAANYAAQAHDAWAALRRIGADVSILKSETGSTVMRPGRARALARGFATLPGAGHLAPMEQPGACAAWILERMTDHAAATQMLNKR